MRCERRLILPQSSVEVQVRVIIFPQVFIVSVVWKVITKGF